MLHPRNVARSKYHHKRFWQEREFVTGKRRDGLSYLLLLDDTVAVVELNCLPEAPGY